jgi:hypothetical protein
MPEIEKRDDIETKITKAALNAIPPSHANTNLLPEARKYPQCSEFPGTIVPGT